VLTVDLLPDFSTSLRRPSLRHSQERRPEDAAFPPTEYRALWLSELFRSAPFSKLLSIRRTASVFLSKILSSATVNIKLDRHTKMKTVYKRVCQRWRACRNNYARDAYSKRVCSHDRLLDTRCCFHVQSKADMSQFNLPHRTGPTTEKWKNRKQLKSKKTDVLRSIGKLSAVNPWNHCARRQEAQLSPRDRAMRRVN